MGASNAWRRLSIWRKALEKARQAPDKISRKLQADAKEVEQFLLAKDYGKAMETLETYRLGAELNNN